MPAFAKDVQQSFGKVLRHIVLQGTQIRWAAVLYKLLRELEQGRKRLVIFGSRPPNDFQAAATFLFVRGFAITCELLLAALLQ
jgi:hypothetical protein